MAEQTLDVYRDWLGIKETARPLNHYQLLRVPLFEDDIGKIRKNYRKLNAHVRKYAAGQYGEKSQELLNELAKSMLCLTDLKRKAEYDASLGRTTDRPKTGRSFEEILLGRKIVGVEQLEKARGYSKAIGVDVRTALIQQRHAPADAVTQAYAESEGVPFVDLSTTPIDELLVAKVPTLLARQNSCVPVAMDGEYLLVASPNPLKPEVEDELRLRFEGVHVRSVLCTPASVNEALAEHFSKEKADAELEGKAAASKRADPYAGKSEEEIRKLKAQRAKEKKLIPLLCFNFGFMGVIFFKMMTQTTTFGDQFAWGLLGGAVAAGLAWLGLFLRGD